MLKLLLTLCQCECIICISEWERSTQAKKLNAILHETCRMATGCLNPANTNSPPLLAPSDIRRAVESRTERERQTTNKTHPLNGHTTVVPRLKSRKRFIKCTAFNEIAKAARNELWTERLEPLDAGVYLNPQSHQAYDKVTTYLRPKKLQSWANHRKNVRLVAEVVRLEAEVVGDRKGQISSNKVDGRVHNLKPAIPNRKR